MVFKYAHVSSDHHKFKNITSHAFVYGIHLKQKLMKNGVEL